MLSAGLPRPPSQTSLATEAFGSSASCGLWFNETWEMLEEVEAAPPERRYLTPEQVKKPAKDFREILGAEHCCRLLDSFLLHSIDHSLLSAGRGVGVWYVAEFWGGLRESPYWGGAASRPDAWALIQGLPLISYATLSKPWSRTLPVSSSDLPCRTMVSL